MNKQTILITNDPMGHAAFIALAREMGQMPIFNDQPRYFNRVKRVLSKLLPYDQFPIASLNSNILDLSEPSAASSRIGMKGLMFVSTGLLERNKTDGALAGILGHELGHIKLNVGDDGWGQQQADEFGIRLAIKAGFPKTEIADGFNYDVIQNTFRINMIHQYIQRCHETSRP